MVEPIDEVVMMAEDAVKLRYSLKTKNDEGNKRFAGAVVTGCDVDTRTGIVVIDDDASGER